jgi:DNA processing protein
MKEARLAIAFLALHPERRRELLERHDGPRGLLAAVRRGAIPGLTAAAAATPDGRRNQMGAAGVHALFLGDPDYPASLAGIGDPPDVLFVKGAIPTTATVAVVGTRRSTAYGRGLARGFGRAIAAAGWALCSGLARGIDGEAHRGTIEAGGAGVGVLGCGPDVAYPREHAALMTSLAASGAIITEYPPGTPPHGWRFPPRNRIISGLSRAVVVVEAGVTGGALVTAGLAMEQGREVFAVPGDVDREASVGCNLLIRDGAIPVLGADDLIAALELVLGPAHPRTPPAREVPDAGIGLEELGVRLGLGGAALTTWLGRRELEGTIRVVAGRVFPNRG